jgi:hypothetical protein
VTLWPHGGVEKVERGGENVGLGHLVLVSGGGRGLQMEGSQMVWRTAGLRLARLMCCTGLGKGVQGVSTALTVKLLEWPA